MTRRTALVALAFWTLAVHVAMVGQAPPALRLLLAAPVLYMPGRLTLGCFNIRQPPLDRGLSSLLLSIGILIMCGLALHLAQALTPAGWLIGVGVVTALLIAFGGGADIEPPRSIPSLQPALVGQVVVALALAGPAFRATLHDARVDRPFEVLEMWLVKDAATGRLQLGIHNGESADKTLALEIRGEGRIVEDRRTLTVRGNSTMLHPVDVVAVPEKPEAITAVLYAKNDTIARRVKVLVGAKQSADLDSSGE